MPSFSERINNAVLSKIDRSLERLSEELQEVANASLEVSALKPTVLKRLEKYFIEPSRLRIDKSVGQLGSGDGNSPLAAANFIAWQEVAEILKDLEQSVRNMAANEKDKVDNWLRMFYDEDNVIHWNSLLIFDDDVHVLEPEVVDKILEIGEGVLADSLENLQQVIDNYDAKENGLGMFARDLAAARLEDSSVEQVIADILAIQDHSVALQVQHELQDNEHSHRQPLVLLAHAVRAKLYAIQDGMEPELISATD